MKSHPNTWRARPEGRRNIALCFIDVEPRPLLFSKTNRDVRESSPRCFLLSIASVLLLRPVREETAGGAAPPPPPEREALTV